MVTLAPAPAHALANWQIQSMNETAATDLVDQLDLPWADYWESNGSGAMEAHFRFQDKLHTVSAPVDYRTSTADSIAADLFDRFQTELERLEAEWEALLHEESDNRAHGYGPSDYYLCR